MKSTRYSPHTAAVAATLLCPIAIAQDSGGLTFDPNNPDAGRPRVLVPRTEKPTRQYHPGYSGSRGTLGRGGKHVADVFLDYSFKARDLSDRVEVLNAIKGREKDIERMNTNGQGVVVLVHRQVIENPHIGSTETIVYKTSLHPGSDPIDALARYYRSRGGQYVRPNKHMDTYFVPSDASGRPLDDRIEHVVKKAHVVATDLAADIPYSLEERNRIRHEMWQDAFPDTWGPSMSEVLEEAALTDPHGGYGPIAQHSYPREPDPFGFRDRETEDTVSGGLARETADRMTDVAQEIHYEKLERRKREEDARERAKEARERREHDEDQREWFEELSKELAGSLEDAIRSAGAGDHDPGTIPEQERVTYMRIYDWSASDGDSVRVTIEQSGPGSAYEGPSSFELRLVSLEETQAIPLTGLSGTIYRISVSATGTGTSSLEGPVATPRMSLTMPDGGALPGTYPKWSMREGDRTGFDLDFD